MSELREMVERLGHSNVRTVLNSGNVVLQTPRPRMNKLARSIGAGIASKFGISVRLVVVAASDSCAPPLMSDVIPTN